MKSRRNPAPQLNRTLKRSARAAPSRAQRKIGLARHSAFVGPIGVNLEAIESYVDGDRFTVRVELPGIDPKEVDIKVAGGVVTVKGSHEQKTETKKRDFFRHEIRYGAFERSVPLPEGMKAEDLKATYRDGVLELSGPMPKVGGSQGGQTSHRGQRGQEIGRR